MKKISCLSIFLMFSAMVFAADQALPSNVTPTGSFGIAFDGTTASIALEPDNLGVQGMTLKFLNENRGGFEIPVSLHWGSYNHVNDTDPDKSSKRGTVSIGSGFGLILPIFQNEYFRVQSIPEVFASYTADWNTPESPTPYEDTLSWYFGISHKLELEIPIAGIFGLPKNLICMAAGLKLMAYWEQKIVKKIDVSYNEYYWDLTTSMYGVPLNTLSIRCYF